MHQPSSPIAQVVTRRYQDPIFEYRQRQILRANLTKAEIAEMASPYAQLDAERAAKGLPAADRIPWAPEDFLKWRTLTRPERTLDLKCYAWSSDRAAGIEPLPVTP